MQKSTFTAEHRVFTTLLAEKRLKRGFTQVQLAEKLGTTQSIISKWERGELRLDFVQIYAVCQALGITLATFAQEFERRCDATKRTPRSR